MKTRLLIIVATFVLFSSLFTINEADALIVGYSLEDLAEKAEFVLIGEVIEISPNVPWYLIFFTDGYDRFLFDVTLSVEDDLDGTYGKDIIIFRIIDSREEFGDHIEDEQNFEIGERVLVFIGKKESDSMGDAYRVTGVTQGKYLLEDGIAFGTDFPEGISENKLILKIKNIRLSGNIVDDEPLVPEPGPICPAGTTVKNNVCVIASTDCGEGTTYQDGICVVNTIENSTTSSSNRWGMHGYNIADPTQYIEQKSVSDIIPPPLKQMKLGIKLGHIICDKDKNLVWNTHYKPSCVYFDTESELIKRGWAKLRLLLPAGPDPIKELDWMGRNVMSMMLEGTFSYNSTPVETLDEKRAAIWEYSKQYHPGEQYLEYAIIPHQYHYNVDDKVQFDLLEWGNYSDCWDLKLRIIDRYDQSVFENNSEIVCLESDGTSGTFNSYSMGGYFDQFVCNKPGYYRIEVSNGDVFPPTILQNFACLESEPERTPPPEPKQESESEIQLYNAKKSLQTAYREHLNLGPYYMKDVIVGYGTYGDTLIVDIASKYTDSDSIQIVKKEIRAIVGDKVNVDFVVHDRIIESHIATVIPYLWNQVLHQNKIDYTPKDQTYWNHADGFREHDRVCSPLVAPNGTEFYISSTFNLEPFEITGTFIDKTEPDDCHKIWRTDVIMQEPDRVTALWLENEN